MFSLNIPIVPVVIQPVGVCRRLQQRGRNNNITSFVEGCFTNKTASALNITVNNASEIIDHCFYQYKLGHINKVTHHSKATSHPLGLGTLLAPGQLVVTGVKH